MLQRLPGESLPEHDYSPTDEDWRRTMLLLSTATSDELVDPRLPLESLLLRLFHEEGVRVFQPLDLCFRCRCSRQRVEVMLRRFPPDDLEDMKQADGQLVVTCEFCNSAFRFGEVELARLHERVRH